MDAICAISTALSESAISVIRISGSDAFKVAERVFFPVSKRKISEMSGYTCAYGEIKDENERIDDAVLTVFKAPHSYTGEDTAEISCHGGAFITKKIFDLCCKNGARPAERGEFTKLAFINGKLSLTQAESVMDIISAKGDLTLKSANLTRQGVLFGKIEKIKGRIIKLLGELSAWVDYPDEDLPEVKNDTMYATVTECNAEIKKLVLGYDNGMILKNGIPTAIVGKPNTGKSTLMNMLLGYERAIVTDVAGTTRDIIEESVKLGDITLKLSDTAGLRQTDDKVEKIGVELTQKKLEESALVIAVFDGAVKPDKDDSDLINKLKNDRKSVILINKSDIGIRSEYSELCADIPYVIEFSAKTGEGREKLEAAVSEMFLSLGEDDSMIFVNERQKNCLVRAANCLDNACLAIESGMTYDAVTIDISEAAAALAELTGERVTDSVVDEIFSKFCVGK